MGAVKRTCITLCLLIAFSNTLVSEGFTTGGINLSVFAGRTLEKLPTDAKVSSQSLLFNDFSNSNEDNNESEFFDDFADMNFGVGDGMIGDEAETGAFPSEAGSSTTSSMSVLEQRFQKIALSEQMSRQQVSENWKDGYWGVWGCSLDPYNDGDENSSEKTIITSIRQIPILDEEDFHDLTLLVVGRSDGSICWLQMEILSPVDSDTKHDVERRSVATFFETKLVAKSTRDGGIIVDKALQRQDNGDEDNDVERNQSGDASESPFEIVAQIQTGSSSGGAVVEMLPIPGARMLWTIAHDTPNIIHAWQLSLQAESGFLLPVGSSPSHPLQIPLETIHTSPIVTMKIIPKHLDNGSDFNLVYQSEMVVSVSDNGQVVVWEVSPTDSPEKSPSVRVRVDANLLDQEAYEENLLESTDRILSMDVDDQYLYLGSQNGKILIFDVSEIFEHSDLIGSLSCSKSFIGFTNNDPGVSSLFAAGPGILDTAALDRDNSSNEKVNRPPTKTLIAGNMAGGIRQWELISVTKDRLEYWPRMASQKLPGGKPHVYETIMDYNAGSTCPAIRGLLCIQQVLLAATDHDLTVWDSSTGKLLYDMQGLDFKFYRPNLVTLEDLVLVTNGMDNYVCVHDFAMDRISSDTVDQFLEKDDDTNNTD